MPYYITKNNTYMLVPSGTYNSVYKRQGWERITKEEMTKRTKAYKEAQKLRNKIYAPGSDPKEQPVKEDIPEKSGDTLPDVDIPAVEAEKVPDDIMPVDDTPEETDSDELPLENKPLSRWNKTEMHDYLTENMIASSMEMSKEELHKLVRDHMKSQKK